METKWTPKHDRCCICSPYFSAQKHVGLMINDEIRLRYHSSS